MKKIDKALIYACVPFAVALIVFIGFSVIGHITKNADEKNPTATTAVSPINQTDESTSKNTSGKSSVSLVAVGDNLIHNTLITSGKQEDGSRGYDSFYSNIKKYIEAPDIAVINQETMLGGNSFEYSGYPCFNTPWEVGEAAIDAGFDIFTCANNHSMDVGFAGIQKGIEFFNNHKQIVYTGINSSEEEYNTVKYYEKNNIIFALLNYTYGTNGIPLPEDKPWAVDLMDKEKIKKDLTEARKNADVVIVFPHWGTENSHKVSSYQEEYAKLFSDYGVDIVIGTHPHVLQPVEWIKNEKSGKQMLVYYSLGNFISHQTSLNQLCGGMAEISIEKNDGEIKIKTAKLIPVVCHYKSTSSGYEFSVYRLSDYTDDLAKSHSRSGATVKYFTELSKGIIDEPFLG